MECENVSNSITESPTKGNVALQDGSDPDFVWEDYLEDTNAVAAPPTAFTHVEYSLESGFKVGMKLEIPSSDDGSSYWVASVIMTCGELLSLRFAGYGEDRSADFWFNIKSGEVHPVGWCSANKKKLWPPKGVIEKYPDVAWLLNKELNNIDSTAPSLSEDVAASFMPIDQIKNGMKLEVLEAFNPQHVWIATIIQNVGGRLLLRYDGNEETLLEDFWLFYLSDRLQPIGFGRENNLKYIPPKENFCDDCEAILNKSIEAAKYSPFPAHIFEPKLPIEPHEFKEGMKLEAVDPKTYSDVCPATVSKVINDFYFIVTIDDHQESDKCEFSLCCHNNSPFIFPINWAEENGLELRTPKGYEFQGKFEWDNYLEFCKAIPAPAEFFLMSVMNMGFDVDMKCEAADPFVPSNITAATVMKIVEPLMWLHFDNEADENKFIIMSMNSFELYPVGWCASNSYPLQTPINYKPKPKLSISSPEVMDSQEEKLCLFLEQQHGKSWCSKIYFNHRCFSGPLLSKSRLAELPQAIGPGPVRLVLHEVITRVVNIAYKSSQVLQLLQASGKCRPYMQQQMIKAKYKGKSYRAVIETVRNAEQVEDFCKEICAKLECCPHLFGPQHIEDTCPSNCHTQTKTKFGYNFVKKKKVGRPPLSSNNTPSNPDEEVVKRGPGRRKKRKHWTHLLKAFTKAHEEKKRKAGDSSETDDPPKLIVEHRERRDKEDSVINIDESDFLTIKEKCDKGESRKSSGDSTSSSSSKIPLVGKKKLKHTPSSNIVTRGAKLPNFGLWHHLSVFHSRRGRPRTRPIRPFPIPGRKVGRPLGSTKKAIAAAHLKAKRLLESEENSSRDTVEEKDTKPPEQVSKLESSPLDWSVEEVVKYLQKTECAPLAPLIKDQEIDGQALLMLNQVNVQEHLHLKPEPAKKFCYLVKHLKLEFFTHFAP
nr:scm-like with four MBT domains protein 2 [Parasteatoda tepidariorum]